jgi:alanine dehydrogenase
MLIGVPREIKDHEYRVGVTPSGVTALVTAGHQVRVQAGAGARIGFSDESYRTAGASIVPDAAEAYEVELVVKVKEPQLAEYVYLKRGVTLFCYLHLAAVPELARELVSRGVQAIAYETVTDAAGGHPLLTPMSEVAGRLALQVGAQALTLPCGGNGTLLAGVPGVPAARIAIIGSGVVGTNAAQMAAGMGADVTLIGRSVDQLRYWDPLFRGRVKTLFSSPDNIARVARESDLLIGAVYVPGKQPPKLLSRELLASMRPGSALVDVAIDQGGISETSRPTTHSAPFYVEAGIVHYCVTNMPSATARTSTLALTQVTLPHALRLANLGWREALIQDAGLRAGLNVAEGQITHGGLAEDLGLSAVSTESILRLA